MERGEIKPPLNRQGSLYAMIIHGVLEKRATWWESEVITQVVCPATLRSPSINTHREEDPIADLTGSLVSSSKHTRFASFQRRDVIL